MHVLTASDVGSLVNLLLFLTLACTPAWWLLHSRPELGLLFWLLAPPCVLWLLVMAPGFVVAGWTFCSYLVCWLLGYHEVIVVDGTRRELVLLRHWIGGTRRSSLPFDAVVVRYYEEELTPEDARQIFTRANFILADGKGRRWLWLQEGSLLHDGTTLTHTLMQTWVTSLQRVLALPST
jgi:hypothetical protein